MKYNIRLVIPESESIEEVIANLEEDLEGVSCTKKGEKKISKNNFASPKFGPADPMTIVELGVVITTSAEIGQKAYDILKKKIESKNGKIKLEYDGIEETVFNILENICDVDPNKTTLVSKKSKEKYWIFHFKEEDGKKHLLKMYKDKLDFDYEEIEDTSSK